MQNPNQPTQHSQQPQPPPPSPSSTSTSTSSQPLLLHPFLTYNPTTQQPQLHEYQYLNEMEEVCFVSLVQVKSKDFGIFGVGVGVHGVGGDFGQGIYVSRPVRLDGDQGKDQEKGNKRGKYVCYLVLTVNQSKIPQKFQDLFASLALILSPTCVFDISSKYLRPTKSTQTNPSPRSNYVIMNTSNTNKMGQIYKASIISINPNQPHTHNHTHNHNQNSKMEISTKMAQDKTIIFQEFVRNRGRGYRMADIRGRIGGIFGDWVLWRNFGSFQELQYRFYVDMKLNQYLEDNSAEYRQLKHQQQMLSLQQLNHLLQTISNFTLPQPQPSPSTPLSLSPSSSPYHQILQNHQKSLSSTLHTQNKSLSPKFLSSLKKQFFSNTTSLQQIAIKKQLALKILEEYGVDGVFVAVLCYEDQGRLLMGEVGELRGRLGDREGRIWELGEEVRSKQMKISQYEQTIKAYQQKFLDFKSLNQTYLQKCSQLSTQTSQNLQLHSTLQQSLQQCQSHQSHIQSLLQKISQIQQQKSTQQSLISSLYAELKKKQECVKELRNMCEDGDRKLRAFGEVQDRALRWLEQVQVGKVELGRVGGLLRSLEGHFQAFKRGEIQKFNYVLKRNAEVYRTVKRQSQQKSSLISQQQKRITQLTTQLQAQKTRLKYLQQKLNQHLPHLSHQSPPTNPTNSHISPNILQPSTTINTNTNLAHLPPPVTIPNPNNCFNPNLNPYHNQYYNYDKKCGDNKQENQCQRGCWDSFGAG